MNEYMFTRMAENINELRDRIQRLEAQETTPSATVATVNTLIKRDGSGGAAVVGLSATGSVVTPRSNGSAVFGLDATNGSTLTIANNAVGYPFSLANNFEGMILIADGTGTNDGMGVWITGGGLGMVQVAQIGSSFTATSGNAGTTNVYNTLSPNYSVAIENKRGASRSYAVLGIRLRGAN